MPSNTTKIDDLQIDIVVNAKKAETSLNSIASSFKKAGAASTSIKTVAKTMSELSRSSSATADVTENLSSALNDTGASAEQATPKLRAVTKTLKQTSNEAKLTAAEVKSSAKTTASSIDNATKSAVKAKVVSTKANSQTRKSLKEISTSIGQTNSKLAELWSSFKRIAMYRMIRSVIRMITTAVKEGLEMFVTWDREQNNGLAGAAGMVDELKGKWFELKGAIGAAIAPLLQSLLPVIKLIADAVIGLINIIQQVIRAIMGEDYWYRAVYKDVKNATGAAKELQRVLFGFDELNVLPSLNKSGSAIDEDTVAFIREDIPEWLKIVAPIGATILGIYGVIQGITKLLKGLKEPLDTVGILAGGVLGTFNLLLSICQLIATLLSGFTKTIQIKTNTKQLKTMREEIKQARQETTDFADYLNENPLTVTAEIPTFDFKSHKDEVDATNEWLEKNHLKIILDTPVFDPKPLKKAVEDTNKWLKDNPVSIHIGAKGDGLSDEIKTIVKDLQKEFDKNIVGITLGFSKSAIDSTLESVVTYIKKFFNNNPIRIVVSIGTSYNSNGINSVSGTFGGGRVGAGTSGGGQLTGVDDRTFWEKVSDWIYDNINKPLGWYASGGVPDTGTLFYAGEAGAEVVANMGHSTGVMNISQMQDAVANGNIEVVNAVYAMANMVSNAINGKNFDVYMDAQKVGQSVTKYQNNQARRFGGSVAY